MAATEARSGASARGSRVLGWSGLLLALGLAAVVAGCATKSEDQLASEALEAGLQAHSAGQLDAAATSYREVLKHDPRNKFAYFDLGVIDQTEGRSESAENNYRIALSIDPEFQSALWNLALIRGAAGAPADAINLWRRFLKLADSGGAHYNLALQLRAIGDAVQGNAEMEIALQLDPSLIDPDPPRPSSTPGPGPSASPSAGVTASPPVPAPSQAAPSASP